MDELSLPVPLSTSKKALLEVRRLRARVAELERSASQPIAVIGLGLRLPGGAVDADSFWRLLVGGADAIRDVPAGRWETLPAEAEVAANSSTRRMGFLDDVYGFDRAFFGIGPKEAETMDPQHRLLLEVAWEALENAAIAPSSLSESETGVFVGVSNSDSLREAFGAGRAGNAADGYASSGNAYSMAAGRLAYFLGLHGPGLVIDTACSSSLVAVHLACQSLRAGECRMALAGGVNAILGPEVGESLARAKMLSPSGRCRAFDATADGFVRGEGCGVVVLKPLAQAVADGDPIRAVITGSAINHDGRSNGITAPNGAAQETLIRRVLANAGVAGDAVQYVEAHGTGTPLGDPIEVHALAATLGTGRSEDNPLFVGSVKANLGHLEAAAGIAGLIKTVLALEHGQIPPQAQFESLNPAISLDGAPVKVPVEVEPWPATRRRLAGISSFGFSGTNAHVVLEAAPTPASIEARSDEGRSQLCLISARTPEALRAQISRLTDWIDAHPEASLADVCQTLNAGRSHFGFRLALVTGSLAELRHKLTTAEPPALSVYDANVSDVAPDFVLPGRGQLAADSTEERSAMLENLARLYEAGAEIDWRNFHSDGRRGVVALPSYPFEHEECRASRQAAAAQEPVWPLVEAAARLQAMQCPLDLDWASYPTRWAVLDRYTTRAMTATLRALGVFGVAGERHTAESLALQGGVIPAHLRLLARWLDRLADAGFLRRVPAGDFECVAALSGDVARPFEPEERDLFAKEWGLLEYVESSGIQAAAILRGDASAIEPLFAGGSFARAESIYEHSPLARYCNGIVRAAVQTFAQMHRGGLRVLEIGAGTGATTASVLPALPAERAIYTYTDVSEAFLTNARKRFGAAYPMEFAILDLDRPPVEQGFAKHAYDIVLATNAVHATVNCDRSLAHIRSLLRPGGLVVLSELTQVRSWFDISSGFIEGWRKGDDKRRGDGPLLGKAGWIEALTDAGFPHIAALPEDGEFAGIVGQHVFVAGLPGGNVTPPVFVPADHAGVAPPATAEAARADTGEVFAAKLRTASATQRRTLLIEFLSAMLSRILQLDPSRLDRRQRLVDLGIDSLLALEFRDLLAQELKTEGRLSATLVFDYPTIEALAAHLETNFANEDREAAKHDELNAAAGSLEKLSEEEAGLLLASSLKALYK